MADIDAFKSTEWVTRRDLERCNGQEELEALEAALLLRAEIASLRTQLAQERAIQPVNGCGCECCQSVLRARYGKGGGE